MCLTRSNSLLADSKGWISSYIPFTAIKYLGAISIEASAISKYFSIPDM